IIHKGGNYGYSQREGNQLLQTNNLTTALPGTDTIANELICTESGFTSCTSNGTITPLYPVVQYGHGLAGQDQVLAGDSISSGFVYRGNNVPQLYGKYLFGDITTGAVFYADYEEMLADDDGDPSTQAAIHSLDILWDDPNDAPDDGEELYETLTSNDAIRGPMFQIIQNTYIDRTGLPANSPLPQTANVTGAFGRADIRIAVDADGELYILSKSDGMIRAITGPEPLPGDYNYDGVVDDGDYETWKAAYGTTVPRLGLWADGNQDGFVDAADYTVWRDHATVAGGGSLSVPEPASALLLAAAAVIFCARRRAR
ncbi:MAG: PEP-CTERM sorting domain-containing protein, partial [Pirellulales bacterium]